jgi:hypothetical protein
MVHGAMARRRAGVDHDRHVVFRGHVEVAVGDGDVGLSVAVEVGDHGLPRAGAAVHSDGRPECAVAVPRNLPVPRCQAASVERPHPLVGPFQRQLQREREHAGVPDTSGRDRRSFDRRIHAAAVFQPLPYGRVSGLHEGNLREPAHHADGTSQTSLRAPLIEAQRGACTESVRV